MVDVSRKRGGRSLNSHDEVRIPADLLFDLDELADRLATPNVGGYAYPDWSAALRHVRRRIALGDPYGIQQLLAMFGGMGSLNDLIIDHETTEVIARVRTVGWATAVDIGLR
ncbi:DUF6966 domain-containing protein [Tsukamurella sp. DT100]|uniref:DUF6966 domain-containing protein n=1 Tax=Tsukamurella sp. DT100 TaxID=3393415 RepID=UPI003CEC6907